MLSDLITKLLLVFFGYAYPAFECFKAVENHPYNNQQLRFWCHYWIIVTAITVVERFGYFSSWLPMYGEAKLAFLVYLWFPKTKGSDVVYEVFLRPLVMQYEPDMEERFRNLRAKSGELLQFYLQNFTEKGHVLFLDALRYMVSAPLAPRTEGILQQSANAVRNPTIFPELGLTADEVQEDAVVAESLKWRRRRFH
ncbi:putative HVA22-like protein g [Curcuma longa]|uniref:putative HVA22-like protein g n=1 Tax=Curcuma longa TaxID=136217 RepID=UPI003D9F6B4E